MSSVPPSPQAPSPRSQTDCPSLPLNPSKLVEKIALGEQPADIDIPDNYVAYTLRKERELPPLTWSNFYTRFNYVSLIALTATPAIAIYGICTTKLRWETALFAIFYYFVTGLGTSFLYCSSICLGMGTAGKDRSSAFFTYFIAILLGNILNDN